MSDRAGGPYGKKTVPEDLSTARGRRPRALLKTKGTVFSHTDRPVEICRGENGSQNPSVRLHWDRKEKISVPVSLSSHSPMKGPSAEKLEENFFGYQNSDVNTLELQYSLPDQ